MEDKPSTPLPEPSGEANPKSAGLGEGITPPSQPQPETGECNLSKPSKMSMWWKVWWPRAKTAWLLFGELVMLLWAVALWDSYRPKITVTPGGTLNSKIPFGTYFIMQNQGSLPISKITYLTRLSFIGLTNQTQFVSAEQNVAVIPQMKSMESYTLGIHYPSVQVNMHSSPVTTNQVGALSQNLATNETRIQVLLLSFNVSYEPKFFGKRTDTLYFFGTPDVDGNWQWLPTAHQSITEQTIDTNLIAQIQKMNPTPIATSTNGSIQVHTNQVKPN